MLDLSGMNRPFCGSEGTESNRTKTRVRDVSFGRGTRPPGTRKTTRAEKTSRGRDAVSSASSRVCRDARGATAFAVPRLGASVETSPRRTALVVPRRHREIRRAFASEAAAARERGERAEGGRDVPQDRRAWLRWFLELSSVGAPREVARRARRVPKSKEKRLDRGNARSAPHRAAS